MRMIMEDKYEKDFQQITNEYLEASEVLAHAAGLASEDPIKQDMIAFIQPQFVEMCAKAEGVRVMSVQSYHENKEFILQEMKEITKLNLDMARQIREKLGKL